MKAIVYKSNTGSTANYAKMLGNELNLPVYSLDDAKKNISNNSEVIYLGWLMAGGIKGYSSAVKKYNVCAVCAVGMGQTGTQIEEVRNKNSIPNNIPLFTLQGNFNLEKLHGVYKMMMNVMVKTVGKALANKENPTQEEQDMIDMMVNGERVKVENLKAVIDWYNKEN